MQSRSTPVTSARPGGLAWFGAVTVWTGAAVLSFAGLDGLATTCHITPTIAWLLPIVIDVGVAVAAWVWRRGINPEASRLAGRLTWSLLVLTVVGNGAHLGMEASRVVPPWWVAALVGAVPPAVAGATAHLLVLLGRSEPVSEPVPVPAPVAAKTPVKTAAKSKTQDATEQARQKELRRVRNQRYAEKKRAAAGKTLQAVSA